MMEIIILGSGTGVPSIRRAGPATCLRVEGQTLLIDSAAGTLRQLVRAGISYDTLDILLYTHFHPDHIGELAPFIFATRYPLGYKRNSPVTVMAAKGLKRFYQSMIQAFGQWVEPEPGKVFFEEIPQEMSAAMQLPPLTIRSAPTNHTPQSLAYRIETSSGRSVVFSGDTDFCDELIELAQGTDLLVSECAAPEGYKIPGHLTPSEAGKIAQAAGVKRLLLNHFYPNCDEHDLITPCSKVYKGPIILSEDFMRLVLL
ncbi:MAG: MBL fold metallo-hydrolase [Dissulfuribacterales bacterium]